MSLETYRRKRDFQRTSEPRGDAATGPGYSFVVQKHAARRLHFDFRLELDGVLVSWAIPKGPSVDPAARRLAVHVEDHPLDYAGFEGVIPRSEYGGGTVMVWDSGRWRAEGDPRQGLRRGSLKFHLFGQRLQGAWRLVRSGGKAGGDRENWFLIKSGDGFAGGAEPAECWSTSVVSGRTMEQIAAEQDRVWRTQAPDTPDAAAEAAANRPAPELAAPVDHVPGGRHWVYEAKLDGYRILACKQGERVQLFSRNGKDWTGRFPVQARQLRQLPVSEAWLDGEVVVLDKQGRSHFSALQQALSRKDYGAVQYFLFDLLFLDGQDLRRLPLLQRKQALQQLLDAAHLSSILYSTHVTGDKETVLQEVCRLGLEGLVAKQAGGPYTGTRSGQWCKIKCHLRQEFVVGGFTPPRGKRQGFGALVVGYVDEGGQLRYAGRVGTGFNSRLLAELTPRLQALRSPRPPFTHVPSASARHVQWVEPRLVVEVAFVGWTRAGILRHGSFQGLREDKAAAEVTLEAPAPVPADEAPSRRAGTRRDVALSNPDKVMYPETAVTKADLADYYRRMSGWILPYVVGRPLTLLRCPDGWRAECFYQKRALQPLPAGVGSFAYLHRGRSQDYMFLEDERGLFNLVQLGVLEIHAWGAKANAPDRPDVAVIDLDPDTAVPWQRVVRTARALKSLLQELSLVSFARLTGGKGIHVVVPLDGGAGWPVVKGFTRAIADLLVASASEDYTASSSKSARGHKIFIDYHRNWPSATSVVNFSTRARHGATVAVPVRWDDLSESLRPDAFTLSGVEPYLDRVGGDPWAGYFDAKQGLSKSMLRRLGVGV